MMMEMDILNGVKTVHHGINLGVCGENKYEGFLGNDLAMSDNCARNPIPCRLFQVLVLWMCELMDLLYE